MELIVAWILFPLALTALALGWGALVQILCGRELPGALLPGAGLAAIVVVAGLTTAGEPTAPLTTPLIAAGALAGLVAGGLPGGALRRRPDPWAVACALSVFAVYAAPVVLSGEATFTGYVKLDDTATWMTLTDRVMEHGRSLDGLGPSSYEATLAFNLADGYPVGVFLPLGVGAAVVGEDLAWVIQPYMAWLAALLALAIWRLAEPVIPSRPLRAGAAAVASVPALLLGYVLWGGIKEVAAAALIALLAALALELPRGRIGWRALAPTAIACAALLSVLTIGGIVWIGPILLGAFIVLARERGPRELLTPAAVLAGAVAVLALPLLLSGSLIPPTSSPLDSASAQGNLVNPLSLLQAFGIWLAGDFRFGPEPALLTYAAVTVVLATGAYGLWRARSSAPSLMLYGAGSAIGMAALLLAGSPWVDGKALATASPALLLLGICGCATLIGEGRPLLGRVTAAVIVLGVVASAVLAYREVTLGPRDQLAELERIGERVEGQGPTLITEYQPYATRHFLRESDPEAPSELRRRRLLLADGGFLRRGRSADTDELALGSVLPFRTLVLRRGPSLSRPPSGYELVERGTYYEVWQRPAEVPATREHLGLGVSERTPSVDVLAGRAAVPVCDQVLRLAGAAGSGGELVAAPAANPLVFPLASGEHPEGWERAESGSAALFPDGEGSVTVPIDVPRGGAYRVWLGGSVRGRVDTTVDGKALGSERHLINNLGQWIELGAAVLDPGEHTVELDYSGPDLHPGSAGRSLPVGPVALEPAAPERPLVTVPASEARSLCGRAWDWIEARPG